jgi:uncharacterized membrane protein
MCVPSYLLSVGAVVLAMVSTTTTYNTGIFLNNDVCSKLLAIIWGGGACGDQHYHHSQQHMYFPQPLCVFQAIIWGAVPANLAMISTTTTHNNHVLLMLR